MSYIGKTPTPAPLTANDITDGIISTSKLADTSVTNAKLNADLISAETELATSPADTDELLISDAGVLKRIDASLIGGGGITQADQWRPTGSTSGTHTTITAWERPDTGNSDYVGSGMTQSSGVFTFPETGKYWIQFRAQIYNPSNASKYQGFDMDTTVDNGSNWVLAAVGYTHSYTSASYSTGSISFLFNCTNTSTHKIRFGTSSTETSTLTIVGGSGTNESEVTFIRLGDT